MRSRPWLVGRSGGARAQIAPGGVAHGCRVHVLPPTGVPLPSTRTAPALYTHIRTHVPGSFPLPVSAKVASEMPRRSEHGDQRLLRSGLAGHPDGPVSPQCHRESPATPGFSHESTDPCPATLLLPRQSPMGSLSKAARPTSAPRGPCSPTWTPASAAPHRVQGPAPQPEAAT